MNIREIVDKVKENNPCELKKVSNPIAVKLIREVFNVLLDEIENLEEGVINIGKLGTFRIRLVDTTIDGEPATTRRIIFKPHIPKS